MLKFKRADLFGREGLFLEVIEGDEGLVALDAVSDPIEVFGLVLSHALGVCACHERRPFEGLRRVRKNGHLGELGGRGEVIRRLFGLLEAQDHVGILVEVDLGGGRDFEVSVGLLVFVELLGWYKFGLRE